MNWHERSVYPSDSILLAQLESLIGESADSSWGSGSAAAAVSTRGARVRLAMGDDGDGIGFVLARRISDLLEIDLVEVRAEHRRMGIARSLLTRLIDLEVAAGLTEARLELAESNESARELYLGLGFVVVGRRTRYYPDGDDALQLSRLVV